MAAKLIRFVAIGTALTVMIGTASIAATVVLGVFGAFVYALLICYGTTGGC